MDAKVPAERIAGQQFQIVFEAIKQLLETEEKPCKKIGFTVKKRLAAFGKRSGNN